MYKIAPQIPQMYKVQFLYILFEKILEISQGSFISVSGAYTEQLSGII